GRADGPGRPAGAREDRGPTVGRADRRSVASGEGPGLGGLRQRARDSPGARAGGEDTGEPRRGAGPGDDAGAERLAGSAQERRLRQLRAVAGEIVHLKRQEAQAVGYQKAPYDALLDEYEPGATTAEVSEVFAKVRQELVPLL